MQDDRGIIRIIKRKKLEDAIYYIDNYREKFSMAEVNATIKKFGIKCEGKKNKNEKIGIIIEYLRSDEYRENYRSY